MDDFAEITALIADRATLFRYGLVGLLREHRPGWSCAEAGVLDEVLAHLRVEPVDVVLLDLQLVGAPFTATLRALREQFPNLRMIGHFNKLVMKNGEAAMRGEFERLVPLMKKGGFIPSVDHQTPPDVSIEQYRIYLRLLAEYTQIR